MTWNNTCFSASSHRGLTGSGWLLLVLLITLSFGENLPGQVSSKIPVGFEKVGNETPLVEGTLLRVYQSFKWNDVRVLELNDDGSVHVQFVGKPASWDNDFKRSSLIISQKELDRLNGEAPAEEEKPDPLGGSKRPDDEGMKGKSSFGKADETEKSVDPEPVRNVPEKSGTTPSGTGTLELIPGDARVVVGIPIRARVKNKWYDATVIEILNADQLKVKWDAAHLEKSEIDRSEAYVVPKVLELLNKPQAEQIFASRAERVIKNITSHSYQAAEFRIHLPLPKNTEKVTSQTPLRPGAKVGLNNYDRNTGRDRWWEATIIDLNWDDTVRIHIDGESSLLDGDIERNRLIITQSELTRLESIANEEESIAEGVNPKWEELVPVTDEMRIVRGTPVYAEMSDGPQDATVIDIVQDKLHVVADSIGGTATEEVERYQVKIRGKVVEALALPGTEEKLLRRAERIMERSPDHPFPTTDYLLPPELPRNQVRVTDQTPLEIGYELQVFSNGKWWPVSIVALNWDGSVRIRVSAGREQYVGDIERRCLVIDKRDLAALEKSGRAEKSPFAAVKSRLAAKSPAEKEETGTTRPVKKPATPSGNFKVILKSYGRHKIQVAQAVSDLTGSEFGDTLTLLGSLPVEVQADLSQKDAEAAARKLRGAGGEVDVVEK